MPRMCEPNVNFLHRKYNVRTKSILVIINLAFVGQGLFLLLRKEVIQPHLPVRLPCYDLVLLIKHTLEAFLLAVRTTTSGASYSDDLTGGVYKTRERIHPAVTYAGLLMIPAS